MKCPNCDVEMENGYLQSFNDVVWTKKPHKFFVALKKDQILFGNAFSGCIILASICKSCKKILIDYSAQDVREG